MITPPVHVPGPGHVREAVPAPLAETGCVVVFAAWREWLPTLPAAPRLRPLLGDDWPRYRDGPPGTVRRRFAAARLLLRHAAAAALDTDPEALDLGRRPGGRPFLRGLDHIEVTLTHSGDLMAAALSRIGRIGVDAEPVDRPVRLDVARARMCTPAEAAQLDRLPAERRAAHAVRLWTLKEAYAKAVGQGMRLPFTEFGFGPPGTVLRTPDGAPALQDGWRFATHPVLDRYLISVARQDEGLGPAADTAPRALPERAPPALRSTPCRAGLQPCLSPASRADCQRCRVGRWSSAAPQGTCSREEKRMDQAERERQASGAEGVAPVLRLAGVDEDEDEPPEPNVIRGID